MAAPSYATDLNDIILEMPNTTGWSLISSGGGGANNMAAPETDDFYQGNNCISRNPWTSANIRGIVYNSSETITADEAVFIWSKTDVTQALDDIATGGLQALVGSGTGALDCYYVDGSDTAVAGGWKVYAYDPTVTSSVQVGSPSGTTSYFGFRWSVATSGPSKGNPYKIDAIRHGRGLTVTAGDSGTPATWDALGIYADDQTRRWGIIQITDTGAEQVGIVNWGDSTTACYSRQTGGTTVFADTLGFTHADFTQVLFDHGSSDIQWTGRTFTALGTANRGLFISNATRNPPVILTSCIFNDTNTFVAESNTDLLACTFNSTNEVTVKGGSIVGSRFLTPTVAADSYAVLYNEAADPDGEFDNTEFTQGTASHHAIEFGTTAPTTMTLRGIDFSGFSGTSTAAALNFLRTTGSTTVNLIGCTGTITAQVTGSHTVAFVTDPVTTAVHVQNINTGADLVGARVFLLATTVGPLPWEVTVTIDRTGSTAEVLHTGHGLATNQWVKIEGAVQEEYNGGKQITRVDDDNYTYAVTGTPTAPATGTIDATAIIIFGVTDSSGDITDQRSYASVQEFDGWVRKSSDPYYKTSPLSGTIDSADGLPITVGMIPD